MKKGFPQLEKEKIQEEAPESELDDENQSISELMELVNRKSLYEIFFLSCFSLFSISFFQSLLNIDYEMKFSFYPEALIKKKSGNNSTIESSAATTMAENQRKLIKLVKTQQDQR